MATTAWALWTCSTVLPAISIVVVGARFYSRRRLESRLEYDDWVQIPALILFLGMAASAIVGLVNHAFGYPDPLPPPDFQGPAIFYNAPSILLASKLEYIIQMIQIVDLTLIKTAALMLYRRIFCPYKSGPLSWVINILIILTLAWAVAFIAFYASACRSHPSAAWGGNLAFGENCAYLAGYFQIAYPISDVILDLMILLVPIYPISQLQMSRNRKIGLIGVFLFALLGFAASITRMAVDIVLTYGSEGAAGIDIQKVDTQAMWACILENGCALIAVNLPCLGLFYNRYLPRWAKGSRDTLRNLFSNSRRGTSQAKSTEEGSSSESDQKPANATFYYPSDRNESIDMENMSKSRGHSTADSAWTGTVTRGTEDEEEAQPKEWPMSSRDTSRMPVGRGDNAIVAQTDIIFSTQQQQHGVRGAEVGHGSDSAIENSWFPGAAPNHSSPR